jgi:hypothetical protein
MSARNQKRKTAPSQIKPVEGVAPEEAGEAPAPENEKELLEGKDNGDDNFDDAAGDNEGNDEIVTPAPKAKAPKASKAKTAKASAKAKASKSAKAPAKAKKAKAATSGDVVPDEDDKKRHFKILPDTIKPAVNVENLSANGGRFSGGPMTAAKKAFRMIAKASGVDEFQCIFSIQECTRNSANKVFTYQGVNNKLPVPETIEKGGKTITIYYDPKVKAYKGDGVVSTTAKATPKSKAAPKQGRAKAAKVAKAPKAKTSKAPEVAPAPTPVVAEEKAPEVAPAPKAAKATAPAKAKAAKGKAKAK